MLLSLQLSRPGSLQGLKNLKICPLSYFWYCKPRTHNRQSGHSQSGQCPGWMEARSEDCFALSLKPEQDYLFNFPNIRPLLLEGIHSVQFSRSVMSNSLWLHGLQHARLSCPSPTPGACSNSRPSSRWCHPTISFSSCLQSFPASGSFPVSQFFASGGQSTWASASASVLPMNIQDRFPLGWTGLISLLFKGLSRVFMPIYKPRTAFVLLIDCLGSGFQSKFLEIWFPGTSVGLTRLGKKAYRVLTAK